MRLEAGLTPTLTLADDPPSTLCDLRAAPLVAAEPRAGGAAATRLAAELDTLGDPAMRATVQAAFAAIGRGPDRVADGGAGGVDLRGLAQALETAGGGEALLALLLARLMEELAAGGAQPWARGPSTPRGPTCGRPHRAPGSSAQVAPPTSRTPASPSVAPPTSRTPASPSVASPASRTPASPSASPPASRTSPTDSPPSVGPTGPAVTPAGTPPSAGTPSARFEPNAAAVEAARGSPLGAELQRGARANAAIYREAEAKTGVPASMVAAIHFNEGHMGQGVGPESGFGLDPRAVTTARGDAILAKYAMGPWERGTGTPASRQQSAVIAADLLKTSAKAAGVDVQPGMSGHDAAVAIHAYGTGSGSKSTKRAQETGRGFMFDPTDPQPHPLHPGGTSIGKDGEVVRVPPGHKQGLLRWDVALPLLDESLAKGAPTSGAPAAPVSTPPAAPASSSTSAASTKPEPAPTVDAATPPTAGTPTSTLRGLPPRAPDALSGTEVAERLSRLPPGPERERFIQDQIESGNIPDSARQLRPVTMRHTGKDGREHELTMHVMPDYLAIGSDADSVRVPMTPGTAQRVADRTGTSLPTTRMVDAIHAAAAHKAHLDPIQWKPGAEHGRYMLSGAAAVEHDRRIDRQLGEAPTGLASGHKKDIVIPADDGKVAIYGARYADGRPVQPYSNVHEATYADYSHGARLVDRTVLVDGQPMDLHVVLADPDLAPLVSSRGPVRAPTY